MYQATKYASNSLSNSLSNLLMRSNFTNFLHYGGFQGIRDLATCWNRLWKAHNSSLEGFLLQTLFLNLKIKI